MKRTGQILLAIALLALAGVITADRIYVSNFKKTFKELEEKRIVTSNKLATAKIVHENLNHVRDLVFKNMDFPGQDDTVSHETHFFAFVTQCVNDLKLKLISVEPARPVTKGLVTTYGYDIEVEGDFFKFGELCAKFENSRRIISLEGYKVNLKQKDERKHGGPERKTVRITMRVDTYRVKKAPEPVL